MCFELKSIRKNVLRGYNLDHTVDVHCRDAFMLNGSTTNACVKHTTGGHWKRPIVVMSRIRKGMDPPFCQDVTAADLRVVVDYLFPIRSDAKS